MPLQTDHGAGDHDAPVSGFRVEWFKADTESNYSVLVGALDFRKDEVCSQRSQFVFQPVGMVTTAPGCRRLLERGSIRLQ